MAEEDDTTAPANVFRQTIELGLPEKTSITICREDFAELIDFSDRSRI